MATRHDDRGETTDTGDDDGGGGEGDAEAGAAIFTEQGCGGCHTLEAAGSSGTIGPNLDDSQPDFELVVDRVTNGAGAMPSFSDKLDEDEIDERRRLRRRVDRRLDASRPTSRATSRRSRATSTAR